MSRNCRCFSSRVLFASVQIEDSSSKHFSAHVSLSTTLEGDVRFHVSDRSDAWHVGQHLRVTCYGDTGELIRANVLDATGREDRTVSRTAGFSRAWFVLLGLFLLWAAWVRYKRDPPRAAETADGSAQGLKDP